MFRNLGKHLVLVYLPDMYDQIDELMRKQGLSLNTAAERVLGLSLHKLGVGIAERWRLPSKVIGAMSIVPDRAGRLRRDEDKLGALAEFSNRLCEIVATDIPAEQRSASLKALLNRHQNLIQLEADDVDELLVATQREVERRYASLLGRAARTGRFARTVATLSGQQAHDVASSSQVIEIVGDVSVQSPAALKAAPAGQPIEHISLTQPTPVVGEKILAGHLQARQERTRPQIARLQLAKPLEPKPSDATTPDGTVSSDLEVLVARSVAEFARTGTSDQTFLDLVRAVATHLDVPRVLAFRATKNRRELAIVGGCGDDIERLTKGAALTIDASTHSSGANLNGLSLAT